MTQGSSSRLLDALFTGDGMREIFSDRGRLAGMLRFEAALAGGRGGRRNNSQ